jgi:hypothetical protein
VPGKNGPVPLAAVAEIGEGSGPARIDRRDRERVITVSAELNGLPLGDVMSEVRRMPAMQNLPAGVRILPAGDSEAFVELFVGFALALLAGVLSVYLVLLLLFHSGTQPIVILAAVPLCGGGAFGLLLLTTLSGMLFSEEVFGRPFRFEHKTVFSLLSLAFFGVLLTGRVVRGWRGRIAMRFTLWGFLILLLAYIGTRFVLEVVLQRY